MLCIDSSGKYWRVKCRLNALTHWGLVTPYDGGDLGSGCGLLPDGTKPLPELIISKFLWYSAEDLIIRNLKIPISKARLKITFLKSHYDLPGANESSVVNEWYGPQLVQLGRRFNSKYHDISEKLCLWHQPNERFHACHRFSGCVYAVSDTTQTGNSHQQANVVSQWLIWLGDVLPWGH